MADVDESQLLIVVLEGHDLRGQIILGGDLSMTNEAPHDGVLSLVEQLAQGRGVEHRRDIAGYSQPAIRSRDEGYVSEVYTIDPTL